MNDEIFDFHIKINNVDYRNTLGEDLRVDRTNLEAEFAQQPIKFAYYSTLYELARDKEDRVKRELETLYANIDAEKRAEAQQVLAQNPKFKYTEKMYENEVRTDERYDQKYNEYLQARKLTGLLKTAKEAFNQKKEMLISIGADARTGSTDMRVMETQAKETMKKRRMPNDR